MLWRPTRRGLIRAGALIAAPAIIGCAMAQIGQFPPGVLNGRGALDATSGGGLGLRTSCAAFWQLDSTAGLDSSGNGNTLTASATAPTIVSGGGPGSSGFNAASFTASSSQSFSITHNSTIDVGGGNFSIQAWVKAVNSAGAWFTKDNGGFANREFAVEAQFTSSNVYACAFYTSGGSEVDTDSSVSLDTNWHHIVMTWDGTTIRLYIDAGTPATSTPGSGSLASTSGVLIGEGGNSQGFANATICLVGIWKARVLTAGNVTSLYNSGNGLNWAGML